MSVWDLDDVSVYLQVFKFDLPFAVTWGSRDLVNRERIRAEAAAHFPSSIPTVQWWAFRITCTKVKPTGVDAENFVKLIIDAFSGTQLRRDSTKFAALELFPDDDIPNVQMVQVMARPGAVDSTRVQVFGRRPEGSFSQERS